MTALTTTSLLDHVRNLRPVSIETARCRRVSRVLMVVAVLSLVDLVLTLYFMTGGGMAEGNPLVRWVVEHTQSAMVIAVLKLVTVVFGTGLMYLVRHHRAAEVGAWLSAAVLVWLTVQWGIYASIVSAVDPMMLGQLPTPEWTVIS